MLPGSSAEHSLRFIADGQNLVGALLNRHDGGLAQDDAVVFDINQGVRCAEIDTDVV